MKTKKSSPKVSLPKGKFYVFSTHVFKSLKEAEDKIKEWNDSRVLKDGTVLYEITGNVYEPEMKLVKSKLKV